VTQPLTLRTWDVTGVAFGDVTRLDAGLLEIDVGELEAQIVSPVVGIDVRLAAPGDAVRITHVLDAVIPSVKPDDPAATFPGILGPVAPAGRGATNRLAGVAVLSVADFGTLTAAAQATTEGESLVDMNGPGAEACPFSSMHNVVLVFRLDPAADPVEADEAIRRITVGTARSLAETSLRAGEPDRVEGVDLDSADPDLPSVAVILQVASEGLVNDTLLYGKPMIRAPAQLIDPGEILDGALASAAYDYAGLRNVTAFYQDNAVIQRLCREHGERVTLAGAVLTLAFLDDPEEKTRWAEDAAALVENLGADGVVMTSFQSGNSHTDVMLTIRACERRGIRTVAIISETNGGLVDMVPEADALVSSGNEDQLIAAWEPEAVLGPNSFLDGTKADHPRPLPIAAYLAAVEQTGSSRMQAVTL